MKIAHIQERMVIFARCKSLPDGSFQDETIRIDNKNNILIYGITMWHRRSSERWEVYPF